MEVQIIRGKEILKKKETNDEKKLRVAAYVRVSSEHDDQIASFENQKKHY